MLPTPSTTTPATGSMTSREFNQDTGRAKKAAASGPVFVTDRGEPTHVLMSIDEYRRMSNAGKSDIELLAMPELKEGEDVDPIAAFDALNDEIEYARRLGPMSKREEELMEAFEEIAAFPEPEE